MRKLIFKVLLLVLVVFIPISAMAWPPGPPAIPIPPIPGPPPIPLPPPIIFPAPPDVVVIPQTNVYTVPDVQEEIFFSGGWWWRPWNGHWYRSLYYDRGWGYYRGVPSFYRYFYAGWRDDFRHNQWRGQPWQYNRIHHNDFHNNWRNWERSGHWRGGGPGKTGGGPAIHSGGGPGKTGGGPAIHGGGGPGKTGVKYPSQGSSKSSGKGSGVPKHQGNEK